uniref:mTERF domain-containing protein 1, mitochondrial n=1 Tax=Aegilops tauschii subsp. strangulata TaxID=200361 RepID=A0A453MZR8_AEGTS
MHRRHAPPPKLHPHPSPLSSPATHPVPYLHRLLSAAAPAVSPGPRFAVEDYLVDTCGLTRAQALKASTKLSHLKSPTNPDAVLAFLAGLGLSSADVAALVARDPKFLCAGVERTLSPILAGLTGLGLSRSEIARVASLAPRSFRSRSVVSGLEYYLPLFSSSESLLRGLKKYKYFLSSDPERVVKPNIELLRECGLGTSDIAKLCLAVPWLLSAKPERVQVMLACVERLGVPRRSGMFRHALKAVESLSEEKLAAKVEYLRNTFRWSDAEVGIALRKAPLMLTKSNQTLQSKSEFLISEMGLEPAYLAHCPVMLCLSLEGRVKPRCYVIKFLKANGLLDRHWTYGTIVRVSEMVFVETFICPHKEAAPNLAEDYDAACRGEMPTNFRFTWTKNRL